MAVLYRVKGWAQHFENNRTRNLKHMDWIPLPNKLDGDGYTDLVSHPEGAAHFGAWVACVEVASKCEPRGTLMRDGARPHDPASLARITRLPRQVFEQAIPRLLSIGWLTSEVVASSTDTEISHEGAAHSHDSAARSQDTDYGREGNGTEGNGTEAVSTPPADAGGRSVADNGTGGRKGTTTRKPGKADTTAKPEHAEFKAHWMTAWNRRHGGTYAWVHAKDDAHAKWILDQPDVARDAEKAKAIVDAFLANDDPWIVERRHSLGLLKSGFNRFSTETPDLGQPNYDPPKEITDLLPAPEPVVGRLIE